MTTVNQNISKILDTMYSMRSQIRGIYLNTSGGLMYSLNEDLLNSISSIIKNKGTLEANVREFNINISFNEDIVVSNRTLQTIYCRIDSTLRNFIRSNTSDKSLLEYINNDNNAILDYYQVGNSLKFML